MTLPKRLVRRHAGDRGISAFVTRAMRHEIQRDRLADFMSDLEREIGAVDEREFAQIDREFAQIDREWRPT